MPCEYVYSSASKRERSLTGYLHIFCVRLLRCPFYCNRQFQGLGKRDGHQVQFSRFFCFILPRMRAVVGQVDGRLSTSKFIMAKKSAIRGEYHYR